MSDDSSNMQGQQTQNSARHTDRSDRLSASASTDLWRYINVLLLLLSLLVLLSVSAGDLLSDTLI